MCDFYKPITGREMDNNNHSSVADWDNNLQVLTDEDLQAIDAIESAFLSSSRAPPQTTTTTIPPPPPSASSKKRNWRSEDTNLELNRATGRRKLPASVAGLCLPLPLSSSPANEKIRYPALTFGGNICYSRTSLEVENAMKDFLLSLEARKLETGRISIGFDIEWRPNFVKGDVPHKAAVMQMCADISNCHVMHIIHSGITPSLQLLLEDPTIIKVGVGIGNDCVKIFKDYNVSVKSVEDLSSLANQTLGEEPKCWGLRSLAEKLVCKELSKGKRVRLGNWEKDVLSQQQKEYAATDAFASWHLYQVLNSLSVSKNEAGTSN